MRILVLSDSHCTSLADLPAELLVALQTADMIVHAGDYTSLQLVQELRQLATFLGVAGNMDPITIKSELPDQEIVKVEGHAIGVMHGWGAPDGLEQKVRNKFPVDIDVVIYGHTHIVKNEKANGTLLFNPGSAIGRFPASFASYGIISVDEKELRSEIIRI